MPKTLFFFLIFLFSFVVNASTKVEIYATSINLHNESVYAENGISVVYQDYILSAERAVYNKKSGKLELFENIQASIGKNYRLLGNYAVLNLLEKEKLFRPFYMLEKSSDIWMSASEGRAQDQNISIQSGIVSGCNQSNPLWKMEFTSSEYSADDMWLDLYNTTLYIYDIPVLYTPYFGYSLDTRRRTGLLMPVFGISDKEGFYYEQPIYIAEEDNWDLELKPQIRSKRGYGGYSVLRFKDSRYSTGSLQVGYFDEYEAYVNSQNLINKEHYGFNLKYSNSDVIKQWVDGSDEAQSGLYLDLNGMSDVDYINLKKNDNSDLETATQVLSQINLFYNKDTNYIAMYFRYYQDLTKENNDDTLQKLPTFHYHSYLDTLLENHLLYNLDAKSTNIERFVDKTAIRTEATLPIELRTSLLDEYIDLSYKANLYGQYMHFTSLEEALGTSEYKNGYFMRNYHTLRVSTDLTKAFDSFTHVLSFGARYTLGGTQSRNGYYEDYGDFCSLNENVNAPECEFYNIENIDEALQLEFTQYAYDKKAKEIFYQRVAQNITYLEGRNIYGELENELEYEMINGLRLYNNMFYNFDKKSFSKIFNKLTLQKYKFTFDIGHLYKDTFLDSSTEYNPYTSYLTSSARYTYNDHYSYKIRYDYDIEEKTKKSSEIGFLYTKRCWKFGLRYVENNRPQPTQNGAPSILDKYVYFTIVLTPIMKYKEGASDFSLMVP